MICQQKKLKLNVRLVARTLSEKSIMNIGGRDASSNAYSGKSTQQGRIILGARAVAMLVWVTRGVNAATDTMQPKLHLAVLGEQPLSGQ